MVSGRWSRAISVVAVLAGASGCQRGLVRADPCQSESVRNGQPCDAPPNVVCGSDVYRCTCDTFAGESQRRWSCVSAGGPLAPPELLG